MPRPLLSALLLVCAAMGFAAPGPSHAQSQQAPSPAPGWPARPVRIIVPFGPGSTPDIVARVIADRLHERLGQPFLVEDKPGASGNIGTDAVAKAEPDGYKRKF